MQQSRKRLFQPSDMAGSSGQGKSEIPLRLLTALILLPMLFVVYAGGPLAYLLFLAFGFVMALETVQVQGLTPLGLRGAAIIIAILAPVCNLLMGGVFPSVMMTGAAAIVLLICGQSWISRVLMVALMLMVFCFIDLTLRGEQHWLLLMAGVVIAADSTAFFGGRFFGGAKLAPKISPSKTWSGAICGLVGGGVLAGIASPVLGISMQTGLLLGILIADFSIGGDLLESWFKRYHNVKDAGRILPGHGGILDRCDGYLLSAPLVYAAVVFGGINV